MSIDFPLKVAQGSSQFPSAKSACCVCDKTVGEVEGFIRLTVGAMLFSDESRMSGGPAKLMDAVFGFWFHGPHPVIGQSSDGRFEIGLDNAECHLEVVDRISGGQVDILFCSTACIRVFFDEAAKALDRKATIAKKEHGQRHFPSR